MQDVVAGFIIEIIFIEVIESLVVYLILSCSTKMKSQLFSQKQN